MNAVQSSNVIPLVGTTLARIISVIHRVKKTADGEEHPTLVAIMEPDGTFNRFDLATEREEFDFITADGKFADIGLRSGDTVITTLGGSGDRLSFAMSRMLQEVGGVLHRIPSFHLKNFKETPAFAELDEDMRDDVMLLHAMWGSVPKNFFECRIRDREIIRISELYRAFKDAQQERMKCANRLRARLIGSLFLSEEGKYPEGKIEDWFDAQKANDPIFLSLEKEEKTAKLQLEKALKMTRIAELFDAIQGCGPSIIGGLICSIGDIRRFSGPEKLASYLLGLSMLAETGKFPRARRGIRTNWNRAGRQTLFLLSDQFNRRPDSEWGKKLRENKGYYRAKHPNTLLVEKKGVEETGREFILEPGLCERKGNKYQVFDADGVIIEEVRGTQRYYDGHIHRMAVWKTLREFVHFLYHTWTEFEKAEYVPVEKKARAKKVA
ncbi:MAG: transposase [Patescibacteria group bacterium]